jgi:hypothetical protein
MGASTIREGISTSPIDQAAVMSATPGMVPVQAFLQGRRGLTDSDC